MDSDTGAAVLVIIVLGVYFLPTIIANAKKHHNVTAIFVTNLFLGWTFIGWVVALVWSVSKSAQQQRESVEPSKPRWEPTRWMVQPSKEAAALSKGGQDIAAIELKCAESLCLAPPNWRPDLQLNYRDETDARRVAQLMSIKLGINVGVARA
jgi:hypothetical protein